MTFICVLNPHEAQVGDRLVSYNWPSAVSVCRQEITEIKGLKWTLDGGREMKMGMGETVMIERDGEPPASQPLTNLVIKGVQDVQPGDSVCGYKARRGMQVERLLVVRRINPTQLQLVDEQWNYHYRQTLIVEPAE